MTLGNLMGLMGPSSSLLFDGQSCWFSSSWSCSFLGRGLISFFYNGSFLEGKSMLLFKFLLLFRCVFEAMFKDKS
jgi:hypothetical protein